MKLCIICGDEYEESRSDQKYCKVCGKDPERYRKHYEIATYINKKNAGDLYKVIEQNCQECGKKILSTYHRTFCSTVCMEIYRAKTAKCPVCNKLLADYKKNIGYGYCSEDCKKINQLKRAKENGDYIPCEVCGKEFIRKNYSNRFCSKDCFTSYREQNKPTPAPKRSEKRNCLICGKEFICEGKNFSKKFCTRECSHENARIEGRKKKEETKKQLKVKKGLHLCTTCKTAYMDCERMTSNFRYMPKGAKKKNVDNKFIIISCPKYKE